MVYDSKNRKVYMVDLDHTLTNGEAYWNTGEEPTPKQDMIDWSNNLYKEGHIIIIYTARPHDEVRATVGWLIKHGVLYHGYNFDKPGSDMYVDDKATNPFGELIKW